MKCTSTENDGAGRAGLNIVKRSAKTVSPAVAYCTSTVLYSDGKSLLIRKASELMV